MIQLEYSADNDKRWYLSNVAFDTQKEAENFCYWRNLEVTEGIGGFLYRIKPPGNMFGELSVGKSQRNGGRTPSLLREKKTRRPT